jgi:6-phosphogluconolactonase
MKRKLRVFPDREELAFAASHHLLSVGQAAINHRGRYMVALSGGSTPKMLYHKLAAPRIQDSLNWERVHIFWGDERCVPPDDEASNYRHANESMLAKLPIPEGNVHRWKTELPPEEAARLYEDELRDTFGLAADSPPPVFDLILMGLGSDGHTASLFPGTDALDEKERWAVAVYVEKLSAWRVTLTPVVFNAARDVVFLVAGEGKADVMQTLLLKEDAPMKYPAQLIQPSIQDPYWFVDSAAVSKFAGRSKDRHWHKKLFGR